MLNLIKSISPVLFGIVSLGIVTAAAPALGLLAIAVVFAIIAIKKGQEKEEVKKPAKKKGKKKPKSNKKSTNKESTGDCPKCGGKYYGDYIGEDPVLICNECGYTKDDSLPDDLGVDIDPPEEE